MELIMYYKHRFMKPQAAHCMNTSSVKKVAFSNQAKNIYRVLITHLTVNMSFFVIKNMSFINNGLLVTGDHEYVILVHQQWANGVWQG